MFELITGPMFSGKTEELVRRVKRCQIAGQKTLLIKPNVDTRYKGITTHDGTGLHQDVLIVNNENSWLERVLSNRIPDDVQVLGIDEAQFFDDSLIDAIKKLFIERRLRIIVSGLDLDSKGLPFGIMPKLLSYAKTVDKLHSVCCVCGSDAYISLSHDESSMDVGNHYHVFCEHCYADLIGIQ